MANKKIHRARVTRRKESPIERFLNLGIAFYNKKQVLYKGDNSLWFAIQAWDKYEYPNFYEYMNKCIEYDKLHNNHKRIKEWQELLSQELTIVEMQKWSEEEYRKDWNRLMAEVQHQINNEG